jgi:hypothetical protein
MAEQKSIVLTAVILAMIVAGGAFYFLMGTSDEKQLDENNSEAVTSEGEVIVGDELAAQLNEEGVIGKEELLEGGDGALSLEEEQVGESDVVDSSMTTEEPAVLGVETVEPTAETGVTSVMMILVGLTVIFGFVGLVTIFRKQNISA